ncbi:MAG: hypothetical protein H6625_12515 [Bdellovibrionaceae bacterium]|nr:hypothetical protein [Pseudobdellovibrionaceae bacterium]
MKNTNALNQAKKSNISQSSTMRVRGDICSKLNVEVEQLNKAKKGSKKISPSDILEALIPLIDDEIRAAILSKTVTSEDRQKVAFSNYRKKHKDISKGDFLELIQYGEIQINDYLPENMKRQIGSTDLLQGENKNVA